MNELFAVIFPSPAESLTKLSPNYFSILDDNNYAEITSGYPAPGFGHSNTETTPAHTAEHLHTIHDQHKLHYTHQGQGQTQGHTEGHGDDDSSVGTGISTQDESANLVSRSFTTSTREVTTRGATAVKVTQQKADLDLDISAATTRDGTVAVGIGNQTVTNGNDHLCNED